MTDLNRLQDETHDDPHAEASAAGGREAAEPTEPKMATGRADGDGPENELADVDITEDDRIPNPAPGQPVLGPDGLPRKKRRRGTRGGQRRKKPAGAGGGAASPMGAAGRSGSDDADEDSDDEQDDV